jgi:hypothetical protein
VGFCQLCVSPQCRYVPLWMVAGIDMDRPDDKPRQEPSMKDEPSRQDERRRVIAEYANDLRAIINKFRRLK